MSAADIREQYGMVTGFLNSARSGTDDTDFTLFTAYLLVTYGKNITLKQVEAEWRDKLLGPGRQYRPGGFSDVVSTRNLNAGLKAPFSGQFGHQMWSDGVAMAISPAGIIAAGQPELAARLAVTIGSVSNGRDGLFAAQAVAAAISAAMVGATPEEMLDVALKYSPLDSWTRRQLLRLHKLPSLRQAELHPALEEISNTLVYPWWTWADLATEAIPLAFGAFLATGGDFRLAVPAGVSMGRDADTIGAIVGSLAGAYCGENAIPEDWMPGSRSGSGKCIGFVSGLHIDEIAEQLVDLSFS
jgi:ADP-ribosylglycohydrolase